MDQPPLDHHYVVLHLGGAKRVTRYEGLAATTVDVPLGALTIVPAGHAYRWRTEGPIDFAHLYLDPQHLDLLAGDRGGGSHRASILESRIGIEDPLLYSIFLALLEDAATSQGSQLYLDTLHQGFALRLLERYAARSPAVARGQPSLAPHRLRRVIGYVAAHLSEDIAVEDLASEAAVSIAHFSRAFARATGQSPYDFVLSRRVERARSLLIETTGSIVSISSQCGFRSATQFARVFRQRTGQTPSRYRSER